VYIVKRVCFCKSTPELRHPAKTIIVLVCHARTTIGHAFGYSYKKFKCLAQSAYLHFLTRKVMAKASERASPSLQKKLNYLAANLKLLLPIQVVPMKLLTDDMENCQKLGVQGTRLCLQRLK
jgi:hypothetical protein